MNASADSVDPPQRVLRVKLVQRRLDATPVTGSPRVPLHRVS